MNAKKSLRALTESKKLKSIEKAKKQELPEIYNMLNRYSFNNNTL